MMVVTVMETKVAVVIPNWNGVDSIGACLDSLLAQTHQATLIVVDNGSADGSVEFLQKNYPQATVISNERNLGFAGGVNCGIRKAVQAGAEYIALLNNDAVADKNWLRHLFDSLEVEPTAGIATGKLLSSDKKHVDSTGDFYTIWGLPFPRDRGASTKRARNEAEEVFGASGGASLYRAAMLGDIGMFDEDFFAYYEDVDLSFRARLAGWKVLYVPRAEAYHATGSTSGKIKGFTTYQTFKNYPLLLWKNVPGRLLVKVLPRFCLAYFSIGLSSLIGGRGWPAFRGFVMSLWLLPKKLIERRRIQKNRKVSITYINSILVHDLPPNAVKLRRLRSWFSNG